MEQEHEEEEEEEEGGVGILVSCLQYSMAAAPLQPTPACCWDLSEIH